MSFDSRALSTCYCWHVHLSNSFLISMDRTFIDAVYDIQWPASGLVSTVAESQLSWNNVCVVRNAASWSHPYMSTPPHSPDLPLHYSISSIAQCIRLPVDPDRSGVEQ